MQKKYGFRPRGAADGPVKTAIFSGNNARICKYPVPARAEPENDRFAQMKRQYQANGGERSNPVYGYVRRPIDDVSVFSAG